MVLEGSENGVGGQAPGVWGTRLKTEADGRHWSIISGSQHGTLSRDIRRGASTEAPGG